MTRIQSIMSDPAILMTVPAVVLELLIMIALTLGLRYRTAIGHGFAMLYETMYEFFEEIIGKEQSTMIKTGIVSLFFVIFIANLIGWLGDIVALAIPGMEENFATFTSERNATFALSTMLVLVTIVIQFVANGAGTALYDYFPVWGKGYLTVDREGMNPVLFYIAWPLAKIFDIVVSMFIGLLDVVGIIAKMISLAFRLYGNMLAGTVLLGLLTVGVGSGVKALVGLDLPLVLPLILFVQGLLVATIQAFVFSLLGAIFIKVAQPAVEPSQHSAQ